jgi:endonuclease/exonuclease/phosphatase family metal-dependent hydrolase
MLRTTGTVAAIAMVAVTITAGSGPAEAKKRTLAAPRSLHALTTTPTTTTLDWKGVKGAKGYRIQYATSAAMTSPHYARFKASSGTLVHLDPQTRYYFRVRAIDVSTGASLGPYSKGPVPSAVTKAFLGTTTPPTSAGTTPSGGTTPPPDTSGTPATTPTTSPSPAQPTAPPTSTPTPGASSGAADVNVASFNLFGVNNDAKATGEMKVWRERRPAVVKQILDQQLDVVGLQEADQSTIYASHLDFGETQYDDLKGALNAAGGHYAVTSEASYNCARAWSTAKCVYTYQGASNSTRILYDTDTLEPVLTGSYKYEHQTLGKFDRYLAWGVFRVKATGGEFLFADTHLDSYSAETRKGEWDELVTQLNKLKNGRPVVSVGDFNTSKWDDYAATYLPKMKAAGYGDVLDQHYRVSKSPAARPQHIVNAWIGSYNHFRRNVADFSYEDARDKIGNNIDWVFASNNLTVKEWQTVVSYDPYSLDVQGVIPSDHNMVRATLSIP